MVATDDRPRAARAATPAGPLGQVPAPTRPPGWWPTTDAAGHAAAFDALDSQAPVLFSPVRIETRFTSPVTGHTRSLRIRIYPDQFHLDDHDPRVTELEAKVGREYWRAWSTAEANDDPAGRTAARQWLVAQLPARRAVWVARQTQPGATAARAARSTAPADPAAAAADQTRRPPRAAALPDRWAVAGFTRDSDGGLTQVFTAWSAPVRADLPAGVDFGRYGDTTATGELPVDDGMRWMVDYDEAVLAGMAVTVDLAEHPEVARTGLAVLLVLGVSEDDAAQSADTVAALLRAHKYSDGVAFVPSGTPTNNTDQVRSPFSFRESDPLALLARELDGVGAATAYSSNGRRMARALGSPGGTVYTALEYADDDEETPQTAMNRALWPVTWGAYIDQLLAGVHTRSVLPANAAADLKRRFLHDVRGGAPLPALRIGAQPYGLLPVRYSQPAQQWADQSPWFEYALHFLRPLWLDTADTVVPRLDPVLGASGGSASKSADSVLSEILASLPQPGRFLVRKLRSWRTTDTESIDDLGDVILGALMPFLYFDDPTFGYEALSVLGRWGWGLEMLGGADYLGLPAGELGALDDVGLADADAQIAALNRLRGRVDSLLATDADRGTARAWLDSMATLVEQHRDRQSPLRELAGATLDFAGIIADEVDDPTIFYSVYAKDDDTTIFELPLVHSPVASTATYLAALRDRIPAAGRTSAASRMTDVDTSPPTDAGGTVDVPVEAHQVLTPAFHAAEPLLYQLLDGVVDDLPGGESTAYRDALDELAAESEERLELRLRESLGLACHRLDAYFTAMARRRLDELRAADPDRGVHLGCYGWVVDLVPDRAGALPSQGFIHAPSIQQATTAAILRAGWSAHGSEAGTSELAVDLSGGRVRLAGWLLDGVRQGQSLGELLGYRFERSLHDAFLDAWIDPVRRAVLLDAGLDAAPRGPVDGLDLLDLYALQRTPAALLADVPAGYLPKGPAEVLGTHLDALAATLDAVGDAAIADSVHQVAQGNMTRAAATLDALNSGDVAPPQLLSLTTPGSGDSVVHRVLLLLGDLTRSEGWATGTARATADPALDAWASSVLGPATAIGARVRSVDDTGTVAGWQPVTMADLGMAALDAVFEAPPPVPGAASAWGRRIEAATRDRVPAGQPQPASIEIDFAGAASRPTAHDRGRRAGPGGALADRRVPATDRRGPRGPGRERRRRTRAGRSAGAGERTGADLPVPGPGPAGVAPHRPGLRADTPADRRCATRPAPGSHAGVRRLPGVGFGAGRRVPRRPGRPRPALAGRLVAGGEGGPHPDPAGRRRAGCPAPAGRVAPSAVPDSGPAGGVPAVPPSRSRSRSQARRAACRRRRLRPPVPPSRTDCCGPGRRSSAGPTR